MTSQREAIAANELLLDRLCSVHPEVYGGGRLRLLNGRYTIVIELSQALPRWAKVPTTFMGCDVTYVVTGWYPGQGVPYGAKRPD